MHILIYSLHAQMLTLRINNCKHLKKIKRALIRVLDITKVTNCCFCMLYSRIFPQYAKKSTALLTEFTGNKKAISKTVNKIFINSYLYDLIPR